MPGNSRSPEDANAVNRQLTPKPRAANERVCSVRTRRILRGYARRVAAGDIDALADMNALSGDVENAISQAVTGLRRFGYYLG